MHLRKLVLKFALGRRSQTTTDVLIEGLRAETAPQRLQITSDGFQPYIQASEGTLADRVYYGMLIKVYAQPRETWRDRTSPRGCRFAALCLHADQVWALTDVLTY